MKEENKKIIQENILNLFGIINSEDGVEFVKILDQMKNHKESSIGELIKESDDMELMALCKVLMRSKFKSEPKPYFDKIVEVLKSELK